MKASGRLCMKWRGSTSNTEGGGIAQSILRENGAGEVA